VVAGSTDGRGGPRRVALMRAWIALKFAITCSGFVKGISLLFFRTCPKNSFKLPLKPIADFAFSISTRMRATSCKPNS
jgi:hypothetical protein